MILERGGRMGKFSALEIALITILSIEKVATADRLLKLLHPLAPHTLYQTLYQLRKKGIIQSYSPWQAAILGLPIPNSSSCERGRNIALYFAGIELEQLWQNEKFQKSAREHWKVNNLEELKSMFLRLCQHIPKENQNSP